MNINSLKSFDFGNIIAFIGDLKENETKTLLKIPPEGTMANPNVEESAKNKSYLYINPVLKITQNNQLYFICTQYTSYYTDSKMRLKYVKQILGLSAKYPESKILFVGDFNTSGVDNYKITSFLSTGKPSPDGIFRVAKDEPQNSEWNQEIREIQKLSLNVGLEYTPKPYRLPLPLVSEYPHLAELALDGLMTNLKNKAKHGCIGDFEYPYVFVKIDGEIDLAKIL